MAISVLYDFCSSSTMLENICLHSFLFIQARFFVIFWTQEPKLNIFISSDTKFDGFLVSYAIN